MPVQTFDKTLKAAKSCAAQPNFLLFAGQKNFEICVLRALGIYLNFAAPGARM
jgi:hypothetical protein